MEKKSPRFKTRILSLCDARGVKPTQVSKETGIGQSTLSEVINERKHPSPAQVVKLYDYFGCRSMDELIYVTPAERG